MGSMCQEGALRCFEVGIQVARFTVGGLMYRMNPVFDSESKLSLNREPLNRGSRYPCFSIL